MNRIDLWKGKALKRRLEKRRVQKQLEEVKQSRSNWKEKAINRGRELDLLKREIAILKKTIQKEENN